MPGGARGSQRASEPSSRFATLHTVVGASVLPAYSGVCASPSSPWGGKRQPTEPKLEQKPSRPQDQAPSGQGKERGLRPPGQDHQRSAGRRGGRDRKSQDRNSEGPGVPTSKIRR